MERKDLMEKFPSIVASVVVSRDGSPLEADLPPGVPLHTYAIMCATIMGAALTAESELGGSMPDHVVVKSDNISILVVNAGSKQILSCSVGNGGDLDTILSAMKEVASEIAQG